MCVCVCVCVSFSVVPPSLLLFSYFAWHTISAYISSGILSEKLTATSMMRLAWRPGKFLRIEFGLPKGKPLANMPLSETTPLPLAKAFQ